MLKPISIHFKLISIFILLSLFSSLCLGYFSYFICAKIIRSDSIRNFSTTSDQISYSISTSLDKIKNTSDLLFVDNQLQNILSSDTPMNNSSVGSELNKILSGYFYTYGNSLLSCSLTNDNGTFFYRSKVSDVKMLEYWKSQAISYNGQIAWNMCNNMEEFSPWSSSVIVVSRSIKNIQSGDIQNSIGVITMVFSEDVIKSSYSHLKEEINIIVTDTKDQFISNKYSDINDELLNSLNKHLNSSTDKPFNINMNNHKYVVLFEGLSTNKWYIISSLPYEIVFERVQYISMVSTLIIIVVAILSFILSYFFSLNIGIPLKELSKEMAKVGEGNLNVKQFDSKRSDELGNIQYQFNYMVDKMNCMMKETVENEKKKQLEEIKALQYQINPHFLYNTLNAVRLKALMSNNNEIVSLLDSLIRLLRNASGKTGNLITLEEELNTLQDYIEIHQARYCSKILLDNKISNEIQHLYIPHFIIEPIVENSIFHGFTETNKDWTITVNAKTYNDILSISVSDNGVGMDQKVADSLLSSGNKDNYGFIRIGLHNINDRIKLSFGEKYGVKITSKINVGTTVELILPVLNHN